MKKSTNTIENENDRNAWLESRGFDHNEFPIGEIRPEWEQFPIIKEYRNYQKSLKSLKTKKQNTIERVWIERQVDDSPDTSFLGKYTDKAEDWAICRHCGEFMAIAELPNLRAEYLEDEIDRYEYKLDAYECTDIEESRLKHDIIVMKFELENFELHECPHYSRECNYFRPYAGGEPEGTDNFIEYGKQDYKRMEGLNNGNWCFIGITAKAEIKTENGILQTITSGGLWGIGSDDKEYVDQVDKEQLENLKQELKSLGFTVKAINKAFLNVEIEDK